MIILRPAFLEDIPALAKLGEESFCAKFAYLYSAKDLNAFLEQAYSVKGVTGDFNDPNLIYQLAEDGEGLTGFCKIARESSYAAHSNARRPAALNQLYTAPDKTGRGIGTALMDWTMAEAASLGADAVQLSVYSENPGAQRFYERYGFEKIADIEFWVGSQCDHEYLYEVRLDT